MGKGKAITRRHALRWSDTWERDWKEASGDNVTILQKNEGLEFLFDVFFFLLDFIYHEIISDYPYFNANSPTTDTVYSKSGMLKSSDHHIQHLEFFSTTPHHNLWETSL